MKPFLFVITGPSGAGKSTIIERIKNHFNFEFSISHTTRLPRKEEKNGVHYYFVNESDFKSMIDKNLFVEWAVVHNHYYGTSKSEVNRILNSGKDGLFDLDVQGAMSMKRIFPESIVIFIAPPSYDVLKERLIKRGEIEFDVRLRNAIEEIYQIRKFDYLVVNDKLEEAVDDTISIIRSQKLKITENRAEEFIKNFKTK